MQSGKLLSWSYFFALALLLMALPLSKFLMSVMEFALTGLFILDGMRMGKIRAFFREENKAKLVFLFVPTGLWWIFESIGRKFKQFFHSENLPAIVFSSVYLMHILGVFYTSDLNYALKDLRIKFPLFLLPLILSTTGDIDRKRFRWLMYLFVSALFMGTFVSTYLMLTRHVTDIRFISPFISHIRYSILIDIGIFILLYLVLKKSDINIKIKILLAALLIWFVTFLLITTSMTGLVILILTAAIMLLYLIFQKKSWIYGTLIVAGIVLLMLILGFYVRSIVKEVYHLNLIDLKNLDSKTALGNPYVNDTANKQEENGNYVWIYVSQNELRDAWNQRSSYKYDGKDKAGQAIKFTLIRYLTSKGLRKDAKGVGELNAQDIRNIEDGQANIIYVEKPGIYVRVYQIVWEFKRYQLTHNPSGHSVAQRFEYWKTAWGIIHDNWLSGVGTGDINTAFSKEYKKLGSLLKKEYQVRSHNQFLSIFVAFGIFGLIWFLAGLLFPPIRLGKFCDYYYLTFFIIIILSMLTEDTIESQAGATIYAFFSSFYLFTKKFVDLV